MQGCRCPEHISLAQKGHQHQQRGRAMPPRMMLEDLEPALKPTLPFWRAACRKTPLNPAMPGEDQLRLTLWLTFCSRGLLFFKMSCSNNEPNRFAVLLQALAEMEHPVPPRVLQHPGTLSPMAGSPTGGAGGLSASSDQRNPQQGMVPGVRGSQPAPAAGS